VIEVRHVPDDGWSRTLIASDTTATITGSDDFPFEPGLHDIRVIAVDSSLARFREEGVKQAGLEGGLGVFGAVTVIRDTVSLPATGERGSVRLR
jgi:hypothetical protein